VNWNRAVVETAKDSLTIPISGSTYPKSEIKTLLKVNMEDYAATMRVSSESLPRKLNGNFDRISLNKDASTCSGTHTAAHARASMFLKPPSCIKRSTTLIQWVCLVLMFSSKNRIPLNVSKEFWFDA